MPGNTHNEDITARLCKLEDDLRSRSATRAVPGAVQVRGEGDSNMKEKPIIFSAESIRAIMAGQKTQTRRVVKPQPWDIDKLSGPEVYEPEITGRYGDILTKESVYGVYDDYGEFGTKCPWRRGNTLWVRETWGQKGYWDHEPMDGEAVFIPIGDYLYKANSQESNITWKSPIFMPRHAARIFFEVTNVRIERLQDITEQGAIAEGIEWTGRLLEPKEAQEIPRNQYGGPLHAHYLDSKLNVWMNFETAKEAYASLWDSINAKRGYSWNSNPWVWVIEFKVKAGERFEQDNQAKMGEHQERVQERHADYVYDKPCISDNDSRNLCR